MKGGKAGRKKKSAGGGAARQSSARGKPKKGVSHRPENVAPPKGSPKNTKFGPRSTAADE